ncbi:MAG: endonuclease/exonuclease/phosphatase family protein, partial [Bdellovibrionales bacterium]|nr:endonuclease/exonuclease/phosphatase family protein [Bdellovibrionales bacterium]
MQIKFICTLVFLIGFSGCTTLKHKSEKAQDNNVVSVMAYNVENLFDTLHDKDREDYSYLPLSTKIKNPEQHKDNCSRSNSRYINSCLTMDWSQSVLERKMKRLANVILQINDGKGPDLLILEEVENINVLSLLRDHYLQKAQYKTMVLIEGPDKRGIDIGLLSRLPQVPTEPAQLHLIPFVAKNPADQEWMNRSRGILQVNLYLPDQEILSVFGVHFPSPHNPQYWRDQAIAHLIQLKNKLPPGRLTLAGGDFNISSEEEAKARHYREQLFQHWQVSHLIGCEDCRGTNYFHPKKSWSFLDALLFDKNMSPHGPSSWYVDPSSIYIPNKNKYQVNRWLSPARFNGRSPLGVSDHWP